MQQKKIKRLTECSINKVTWARKVNFGFVDHVCTCRSLIEMDNLQSYQISRADGKGWQSMTIPQITSDDLPYFLAEFQVSPSNDLLIDQKPWIPKIFRPSVVSAIYNSTTHKVCPIAQLLFYSDYNAKYIVFY